MPRRGRRGSRKSAAFPHGRSIKNPATYEALRRSMGKTKAARISNAALNKGYRKGAHGRRRKRR